MGVSRGMVGTEGGVVEGAWEVEEAVAQGHTREGSEQEVFWESLYRLYMRRC